MTADLSAINKKLLAANREVLIAAGIDPNNPNLPRSEESKDKVAGKLEKELQGHVEQWLHIRGYWKRLPTWIMAGELPPMGWQFHMYNARKNPMLLDVVLLGNNGRWCEFELKAVGGRFSSTEQEALCTVHGHRCFDRFIDVIDYVAKWDGAPLIAPVRQVEEVE